MRFIDFISFNHYPFRTRELLKGRMEKFFLSHALSPYVEAILRDEEKKDFLKVTFTPLLDQYWNVLENDPSIQFSKDMQNADSFSKLFPKNLEEEYKIASHNPAAMNITAEITAKVLESGQHSLQREHEHAKKEAFQILTTEQRIVDFHEYVELSFSNSQAGLRTITLQQFVSYVCFLKSIIQPFSTQTLDSENKKQAIIFCDYCDYLENKLKSCQEDLAEQTHELEYIEHYLYKLNCFLNEHSHEPPPEGHNQECCAATVSYPGIVSSWRIVLEQQALKKLYTEKQGEFLKKFTLFNLRGALNFQEKTISTLFNVLNYWLEEAPRIFNRLDNINQLRSFKSENVKQYDNLYRYVTTAEKDAISSLKCFAQKKSQKTDKKPNSFEREKWFYEEGGQPGHAADYPFRCVIRLKKGALGLLNELKKPDGQFAAVVEKPNYEPHAIGIHEDVLPEFNKLVDHVDIVSTKGKSALSTVFFNRQGASVLSVVHFEPIDVPLFFLLPYQSRPASLEIEFSDAIVDEDILAFEDWYERGMTQDPFTNAKAPHFFCAYTFAARMSIYGGTLPRKIREETPGKIEVRTETKDYRFDSHVIEGWSERPVKLVQGMTEQKLIAEQVFYSLKETLKKESRLKYSPVALCKISEWLRKCSEIEIKGFKTSKHGKPSVKSLNELAKHTQLFEREILPKFTPYLKFIEQHNYVDDRLVNVYFTLFDKKAVFVNRADGFYTFDERPQESLSEINRDFDKVFIFYSNGNYHQLKLREEILVKQEDIAIEQHAPVASEIKQHLSVTSSKKFKKKSLAEVKEKKIMFNPLFNVAIRCTHLLRQKPALILKFKFLQSTQHSNWTGRAFTAIPIPST